MKKLHIFTCLALLFAFACNKPAESGNDDAANTKGDAKVAKVDGKESTPAAEAGPLASFEFSEKEFDFGTINQGDVVKHTFKFKNTGEAPLVISDISTSCGCTTPDYTKDAVEPGTEGEITLQFNSTGKSGKQNKPATIKANVEGGQFKIRIMADVLAADASAEGPVKN